MYIYIYVYIYIYNIYNTYIYILIFIHGDHFELIFKMGHYMYLMI